MATSYKQAPDITWEIGLFKRHDWIWYEFASNRNLVSTTELLNLCLQSKINILYRRKVMECH